MAQPNDNNASAASNDPANDTPVAKTVTYILYNWLRRHMELLCHADATDLPPLLFLFQVRPPALHFQCTELIDQGRHYELELTKEPYVYFMKELSVRWLPHLDDKQPPESVPTILTNKSVEH